MLSNTGSPRQAAVSYISSAPVDLHLSGLFCNFIKGVEFDMFRIYATGIRQILHVEIGHHNIDVGGCVLGCACSDHEVLVRHKHKRLIILLIRWWRYHEITDLILFILMTLAFLLAGLIGII